MNKKASLFLILLFAMVTSLRGQITTSQGFNYYDINAQALETPGSSFDNYFSAYSSDERAYWATSIMLARAVESLYQAPQTSIQPDTVVGAYRLVRRNYFDQAINNQEMKTVILRPNDTVPRPVVLITHGGELSGGNTLRVMTLGVVDLVQRGYAVMYYQSGVDNANAFPGVLQAAGIDSPCDIYNYAPMNKSCLEQRVYFKMQFGYAAAQFAAAQADSFAFDTNKLFLAGFSGGALGSLNLALADETTNFQDSLFFPQGDFNRFSQYPSQAFSVKAVATMGGGLLDQPLAGLLIGPEDSTTRFLMLHGQDDAAVKSDQGRMFWGQPLGTEESLDVELNGSVTLKDSFDFYGVQSKILLNCSGCHEVFSYPCTYCDDCDGNQFFDSGLECYSWREVNFSDVLQNPGSQPFNNSMRLAYYLMQVHDLGLLTAHFLHQDFPDDSLEASPSSLIDDILRDDATAAINPIDYPYTDNNPDGHFQRSSKCLVQNNAALLFNRFGDNGGVLNAADRIGDYLSIPWSSQGQTDVLGSDFTLEFRFKTKNQQGRGTLFSYLDAFITVRGMELFIQSDGTLKFQYYNTFQLSDPLTLVNDDQCHHVAVTRSGNDYRIWIDGEMKAEVLNQGSANYDLPGTVRLGNSLIEPIANNYAFNGIMSEFRMWDQAINDCALHNVPLSGSNIPGLVAHWEFSDGESQTLTSSANGNTLDAVLGKSATNSAHDPKWLENDEICNCDVSQYGQEDASFSTQADTSCDRSFSFTSTQSTGTHDWQFGDGGSSTQANPSHTFPVFGTYQIQHTVAGSCGTAVDSRTFLIDSEYAAQFGLNPSTFAQNDIIEWTYQGGQFGEFVIDNIPQGPFDIWALPPVFSMNNGNTQGIVTPEGLVVQNTLMDNLAPGPHQICFTTYNQGPSCPDTICITVTVTAPTNSPDPTTLAPDIVVFPNPSSGSFFLTFPEGFRGESQISLFSVNGSQLSYMKRKIGPGQGAIELERNDLPAGMYFISIQIGNHHISRKVILK